MRKKYCLDTSVIIHDPNCFEVFKDNDLIIPIAVLEELDHLKSREGSVGANARKAIRKLDIYFYNESQQEINIGNGINLFIDIKNTKSDKFNTGSKDDLILSCCESYDGAILVSKDINMRIRAKAFSIQAQDYENDKLKDVDEFYTGYRTIELTENLEGFSPTNGMQDITGTVFEQLYPNEGVQVITNGNSCLLKRSGNSLKNLKNNSLWSIKSRSKEQAFLLDFLLDPDIPLVTVAGPSGTGKTLLSTAAGLELCIEKKKYKTFKMFKPLAVIPGQDVGFLPGPQPLDAKVLTPIGWKQMGELKVGDFVIGRNGKPTKVLGIYPKGKKMVYKITTTEGSTECCSDHLWYTETYKEKHMRYLSKDTLAKIEKNNGKRGCVKDTKEIMNSLVTSCGKPNHYLPRNEVVEFEGKKLPLPPYLLGVILGDGCTIGKTRIHNTDQELIDRVDKELSFMEYTLKKCGEITYDIVSVHKSYKPGREVKITNLKTGEIINCRSVIMAADMLGLHDSSMWRRCDENIIVDDIKCEFVDTQNDNKYTNRIRSELSKLGLADVICYDKFIPDIYKYSSKNARIDLLRGLMDTDGTIKNNGEASFCTTSKQLALDIIEIIKSLGGRAVLNKRDRVGFSNNYNDVDIVGNKDLYEFNVSMPENINPFYISRKANKHKCSYISSITIKSVDPVGEKDVQCILIEDPEHLYITDDFIVTHNTLEEKIAPVMGSFYDALEVLFKDDVDNNLFLYKDKIKFESLTFIRGRSITNNFIVIDEGQNLSKHDVKTLITRIGAGTKVVFLGDYNQIDVNYLDIKNNGLCLLIEKFKHYDLAAHITLQKCERSPLSALASQIL